MSSDDESLSDSDDKFDVYAHHMIAVKDSNLPSLMDLYYTTGLKGNRHVYTEAVKLGDLEIVKHLLSNPRIIINNYYYSTICFRQLHIAKYLISLGISYTDYDLFYAADNGQDILLEMLKKDITRYVPALLNRVISRYPHQEDVIDSIRKIVEMIERKHYDSFNMYTAFDVGSLDIIKFLHESGFTYNDDLYEVCYSDVEILRYLYEVMGVRKDGPSSILHCVMSGNVECFKYMASKGFDTSAITDVLSTNHIDMVKYLHENKYEWDEDFEIEDINNEIARYCHDNDIPRDWECRAECNICIESKVRIIKDMWWLEVGDSVVQWLPREMLDELSMMMEEIGQTIYDFDLEDYDE